MLKRRIRQLPRPTVAAMRGWLYDRAVAGLTSEWYECVLERLPDNATVLDVGIGTGGAVARCADAVKAKRIHLVGLDIDQDYLERCDRTIARVGLSDHVTTVLTSVYDHWGGAYDAAYFSASLMLLADPVGAIKRVASQLVPGGRIFFTQTFEQRKSPLLEKVKPIAHHLTTIHFGRVTYESAFRSVIANSGLEMVEFTTIGGTRRSSYRLAVARPAGGLEREGRQSDRTPLPRAAHEVRSRQRAQQALPRTVHARCSYHPDPGPGP